MIKTIGRSLAAACGAALLLAGGQALAHAKLLDASPAADATVAAPTQIVLHFSEKLEPKFSGFEVAAGGAQAAVKTSLGKDRKTIIGVASKPLAAGAYQVNWHAVSADGHRMQGSYAFTVR